MAVLIEGFEILELLEVNRIFETCKKTDKTSCADIFAFDAPFKTLTLQEGGDRFFVEGLTKTQVKKLAEEFMRLHDMMED